jgi:hypothetical protein
MQLPALNSLTWSFSIEPGFLENDIALYYFSINFSWHHLAQDDIAFEHNTRGCRGLRSLCHSRRTSPSLARLLPYEHIEHVHMDCGEISGGEALVSVRLFVTQRLRYSADYGVQPRLIPSTTTQLLVIFRCCEYFLLDSGCWLIGDGRRSATLVRSSVYE